MTLFALSNDDGINAGLFAAYIPVASRAKRVDNDAEQVKKLLATRGDFSTSTIWNMCGSRIGDSRVTLQAQKEQLVIDAAKAAAQLQTRTDRQQNILANAHTALAKYRAAVPSDDGEQYDCAPVETEVRLHSLLFACSGCQQQYQGAKHECKSLSW